MRKLVELVKNNGLSIAFFVLFAICAIGQSLTGVRSYNADRVSHGFPALSLRQFVKTGTFLDGVFVIGKLPFCNSQY